MIDRWRMLEERNRREDASSFIVTNDNLILVKPILYSHGFSVIINITGHYLCGEHEKEISLEFLDKWEQKVKRDVKVKRKKNVRILEYGAAARILNLYFFCRF